MNFLFELTKTILEEYDFKRYIPNYKYVRGTRSSEFYILATIKHFLKSKKLNTSSNLKKCMDTFKVIVKNDLTIYHKDKIILFNFYKILIYFHITNNLLDIQENTSLYLPFKFSKAKLKKESKKLKGMYIKAYTPLSEETLKEIKLYNYIYTLFIKNRKLTNFFLHILIFTDLECLKMFENETEEKKMKVLNILDKFLVQHTNEKDILKSLSIKIYFKLKILNFTHDEAQVHTQELMYHLYNYTPNFEEFKKTIYLKSSLGTIPIFASKKTKHFLEEEKSFIKRCVLKSSNNKEKLSNDEDNFFDLMIDSYLKNPHITYLSMVPKELLSKSKK